MGAAETSDDDAVVGFLDVLRMRPFATVFTAEMQSVIGDQLARVALSVLVFNETGSASATASVYAITYLPAILGGIVLAGLGDRMRKRTVMVGADAARALLFVVMAVPGLPLSAFAVALAVAVFLGPAFVAAEVGYLGETLEPEAFRTGTGLRMMANQISQVAGFGLGGVVVAVLEPRGALLVNAATFAGSALLIATRLHEPGPAPGARATAPARGGGDVRTLSGSLAGVGQVLRLPELPRWLALSALAGLFIVPEGLAVPFGAQTGASTGEIGVLLAAIPLGAVLGVVLLVQLVPRDRRAHWLRVMAIGCGLPLVVTAVVPHWPVAVVCWFASGLLAAYQVEVLATMMRVVPDDLRSQLVGLGSAVLLGAQGLGLVVFGITAEAATPALAIGIAGGVGALLAVALLRTLPSNELPVH